MQVPNGELTSAQLRALGDQIKPLGADGCGDITTRANIQLRGMTLAEADKIFQVRADRRKEQMERHAAPDMWRAACTCRT
jgi:sulfite reductase beta subunit-like hemoprotein